MKKNFPALLMTAVSSCLFSLTSCVTRIESPADRNSVSNEQHNFLGTVKATIGCTLWDADQAVRAAAKSNNLFQLSRRNTQRGLRYEFKNMTEERTMVVITALNDSLCEIEIKSGKTGNVEASRKLLSLIDYELNRAAK